MRWGLGVVLVSVFLSLAGTALAHPVSQHRAEASARYWTVERQHQLAHRLSASGKHRLRRLDGRATVARLQLVAHAERRERIAIKRHRRADAAYRRLVRLARRGGTPRDNRRLGRAMANERHGWRGRQWSCLRTLYIGESGWRHGARNASSGALGIPQSLPASKLRSAGRAIHTAYVQIKWGLRYIRGRYGTPCGALAAWRSRSPHWY